MACGGGWGCSPRPDCWRTQQPLGSFILDDVPAIVQNQDIRDWSRFGSVLMPERELPVAGRPLVNVSLAINYALGGLDVRGYHIWNIVVHLGCALLVFGVVRRTLLANRVDRELRERSLDLAFARQERWREAVQQYRQVLKMNPSAEQVIETHLVLANALYTMKSYDEASNHYRQFVQARPDHVGALSRLGITLMATGQIPDAISAFRRAAEINPQDGAVQQNLANALFDARNVDAAAEPARRAVALRPDDPVAHDLLGQILAEQGQLTAAIAEFQRALTIDSNAADAREHLAQVTRASKR